MMNDKTDTVANGSRFETYWNYPVRTIFFVGVIFILASVFMGTDFQIRWTRIKVDGNDTITVKAGLVDSDKCENRSPADREIMVAPSSDDGDDDSAQESKEVMGPYPVQVSQPPH